MEGLWQNHIGSGWCNFASLCLRPWQLVLAGAFCYDLLAGQNSMHYTSSEQKFLPGISLACCPGIDLFMAPLDQNDVNYSRSHDYQHFNVSR